MNPIIPPMAVAINVMPNDMLAANPIAGANRVLTVEANNTERNFHIIITHVRHFELVVSSFQACHCRHFELVEKSPATECPWTFVSRRFLHFASLRSK